MFESFTQFQSRNANSDINTNASVRSTSMVKRITAIVFIFVCASVAWAVLGGTIFSRTYDLNQGAGDRVPPTGGAAHNQPPPRACFKQNNTRAEVCVQRGSQASEKIGDRNT